MVVPQPEVVVAGHICLDVIPKIAYGGQPNQLFVPGKLVEVGKAKVSTGGAVANTGLALHRLGVSTRLVGKVGDDPFGRIILDLLRDVDPVLTERMIVAQNVDSSYTVVLNPPRVDRIFLHHPGANDTFRSEDVSNDHLRGARLFHFGYPPIMRQMYANDGEQLAALLRKAKEQGLVVSMDMAMPDPQSESGTVDWVAVLRRSLPFVDIFMPSLEETLFMLKREYSREWLVQAGEEGIGSVVSAEAVRELAESLLEMGCRIAGLKLGEAGLYLRTAEKSRIEPLGEALAIEPEVWATRELWAPCYRTRVAGTTGAGDCTIAGFLAGLLRRLPPEQAANGAVAVGACSVEQADATSGIIPWETVQERMAAGWERLPIRYITADWSWDDDQQIWRGPHDASR